MKTADDQRNAVLEYNMRTSFSSPTFACTQIYSIDVTPQKGREKMHRVIWKNASARCGIKILWRTANFPGDLRRFGWSGAPSRRPVSQDTLDCRWLEAPGCISRAGSGSDECVETAQDRVSLPENSWFHATNDSARLRVVPRNLPLPRSTRYPQ